MFKSRRRHQIVATGRKRLHSGGMAKDHFGNHFLSARIGVAAALALVAACSTSNLPDAPRTLPHYKIGEPYEIDGKTYTPREDATSPSEAVVESRIAMGLADEDWKIRP